MRATRQSTEARITDTALKVLHDRKGFDWWWEGEIGADNRRAIKRELDAAIRTELAAIEAEKASAAS